MQKMIFVVDDSDTNLVMANEALKLHYNVMTLQSADRLFALLKRLTPDLILLDIEMPEMNGFEVLKQLNGNDLYAGIPVIFLTGSADDASEAYGIELGAVDFVRKPFSKAVLLDRIRYHLQIDEKEEHAKTSQ
jgi:putative two-component system response regulator